MERGLRSWGLRAQGFRVGVGFRVLDADGSPSRFRVEGCYSDLVGYVQEFQVWVED